MTSTYHTPIPSSPPQPANAATVNAPLGELDAELVAQDARLDALEADMPVPSGVATEFYDGLGGFTVPAGTGASVDGHVIQDEGVDLAQRAKINFVGAGVTVTNEAGGTQVEIPGPSGLVAASIDFTATDKLLGRSTSGAGAGEEIPLTAAGRALIDDADAAAQRATLGLDTVHFDNMLINGGFGFAQRQVAANLTTIAQDKYSADRWRISRENADLQYQRSDGVSESGLTSQYFGTYKKITNTGKFMVYQILEGANSVPLRGKSITFQAKLKASSSKIIRMAVIELQNAGALDVIPATFISAWGANLTDPTLGANLAIITAAQSKSVTTSMQLFSVSVTVPSNSKNLICAIWTDSQFAANDTLSIAEAGLYVSPATISQWNPRGNADEILACRYFYEKSYAVDVAIGTSTDNGTVGNVSPGTKYVFGFVFKAKKRSAPTVLLFSKAGTPGVISSWSPVVDVGAAVTAQAISEDGVSYVGDTGNPFTVGAGYYWHYTADAEL